MCERESEREREKTKIKSEKMRYLCDHGRTVETRIQFMFALLLGLSHHKITR